MTAMASRYHAREITRYTGIVKVVLSYLLALGGAGLVAYATMLVAAINCDYPSTRFRLIQALRTQPWQADVMTKNKPGSFFDGIQAAMKVAAMLPGIRDIAIIHKATLPSYDGALKMMPITWKTKILGKYKMGGGAVVAGLGLAISASALPVVHIILLVGVIVAVIYMLVVKRDAERYAMLARLEILPEVDACIAQGRYGAPPKVG
jgi:hypothetical protein